MINRRRVISIICCAAIIAGAGAWILNHPAFLRAQVDESEWKNFSEKRVGLSLDYPRSWSFDLGYDRYSKGLVNVDIVNKKCGGSSGACAADCVDIRVFAGGQPTAGSSQLFIQLYEDMLAVKDTNNPELVQKLDIGDKIVYKILNEAPTLSLNGSCAGPLYIFDSRSGYFVYIFAGYGADAASSGEETVEKVISSLIINDAQ